MILSTSLNWAVSPVSFPSTRTVSKNVVRILQQNHLGYLFKTFDMDLISELPYQNLLSGIQGEKTAHMLLSSLFKHSLHKQMSMQAHSSWIYKVNTSLKPALGGILNFTLPSTKRTYVPINSPTHNINSLFKFTNQRSQMVFYKTWTSSIISKDEHLFILYLPPVVPSWTTCIFFAHSSSYLFF